MRRIGGSIRVAWLGVVTSIVVLVVLAAAGQVGAATYGSSFSGGTLSASPLVVPGAGRLFAGQQQAAEEAKRANPALAAARERSREAYAHLTAGAAGRLLARAFPALVQHRVGTPELPTGARIAGYSSTHSAQLELPGHALGIAESTWPLAKSGSHGHFVPIDLALKRVGPDYAPVRSGVTMRIPGRLSSGISTPGNGVTVTPVNANGKPLAGSKGRVTGATVVYANTQPAADTVVKPTPTGYQLDAVLRSVSSPQQLFFRIGAPSGSSLVQDPVTGVVSVMLGKVMLASISPPAAADAGAAVVSASMSVSGRHTVVVQVDHRADSYLYPIYVDPEVNDSQLAEATGGKRSNWLFKSSNEAKFGHKAVYEGAGKEHLETTGTAEYKAAEVAYWFYETKGNSKIYELKTKTSAKNKLAKIESILQFQTGATNENWKMLSNEFEEPEYSEKVSTICAWNASKVEECLAGAGKEKNLVRFQQSATGSPGSNFKFSDTMSEGIVSISEPAGEHSTTKFNTTSPEVEGEVIEEGKKVIQKRVNALYGAGIWLTNFKGALQFIAEDPGIGASRTHLEYEKSAGVWETLSEHNYLEENLCQGVQCYQVHNEYWTVDPKLPDGEDTIRYRANEAISGTESLSTETESKKTIKVDTSKPHGIFLTGVPFGNELSERKYVLAASATDGTGSTVASSGIEKIKLFIAGREITEHGTQTGCSVAKGECTAQAEWEINGAELGAGHHAIVVVATDKAGNEARLEETLSIHHSTPVALGPGSVDLQSGDYALGTTDVSMGSGLTVARNYSSRALEAGDEGPLGLQWSLNLGPTQSIVEMPDHSVLLTDTKGQQSIFASLGAGEFESPTGDSNLKLKLEENETTKEKLAYYLEDVAKHTKTKFTLPSGGTKVWVPTKQEGTVATDTVGFTYRTVEQAYENPLPAESGPGSIARGPDGNVWFTEETSGKIGKMTPAGLTTEYAVPFGGGSSLGGITTGPDGNLWYLNGNTKKMGKLTPTGTDTEYALGSGNPGSIAVGPDGNLWFTSTNKIGKMTPSGTVTEYALPSESSPADIVAGPDGNLWFTNWYCGFTLPGRCAIGKITTSGAVTEYNLTKVSPGSIAVGSDGNLWYTGVYFEESKIGKITTSGSITEYALPNNSRPKGMTAGPEGSLWFTDSESNKVGKISTSGTIKEFTLPTGSAPVDITSGADGNLWFTESGSSKIGMITTSGTVTEPTEALAPVPAGVSCTPMKQGCRALKFSYASATTATGENQSEWGEYQGRLSKVFVNAYDPVSKKMLETAVSEYSYDKSGRLRAQWDPRVSPALKTTYGYDVEGHVTAMTPPGQESWAFTYGTIAGDSGTGRLLGVSRAPASEALWSGVRVANTEAPALTGSPTVGVRLALSNGKWSGSPISYGYQWEDCNTAGEACVVIAGAKNANYRPVASDVGHELRGVVTATNGGGSVVATTAATGEVKGSVSYALPGGGYPRAVTAGPDGNMWFADGTGQIDKVTTSGAVTKYALPANSWPAYGIASGSDGKLWFTEFGNNRIGKITTAGSATQYTLPAGSAPFGIAAGPDGNLWFANYGTSKIGKITTAGTITEYALAAGSNPIYITAGPDGNLWFTEWSANKIGKISTTGTITLYSVPAGSNPAGITKGPDGNLWFTDYTSSKVGKITTAGAITEYALPAGSGPESITTDSLNHLSFIEYSSSKIGNITTSGSISEVPLVGVENPMGIAAGPDGNVWYSNVNGSKVAKTAPGLASTEGTALTPSASVAIEYGAPLTGGSGLQSMTATAVEKWGQTDVPMEATAILPPDARQGWPASSYQRATTYYLDEQGRTVNTSLPSTATYGSVSTTEYNEMNDRVRTLTADNRQTALEAGSKSADTAKLLATYFSYREECSKESENRHETESTLPGNRLCDVEGPQHMVRYMAGSEQKEGLARLHTKYYYDESAPTGETYNLVTTTVTITELSNEAKEEVEGRVTKTSYSGQSNLGWKLRAPTSVTVDPEGKKLTTTTLYNSSTGQIVETRSPAGPGGGTAHDEKLIYYTAEANTEGYSTCGGHPEWAGLLCESLPAKQPEIGGLPQLPVTTTTYNIWNEPLVTTETFGATVRTKTKTYDEGGRLVTSETTSSADTALPKVTNEYNSKTGVLEKQSTTVSGKTTTITSKYDTLGHLIEYTDADGNIAAYHYGTPENGGLLEEMTDGSNAGTGKQTYAYNATTKQREELTDSAAGLFKASYDAEGNLTSEVYPNTMCANYTHNSVGEATKIEYIKTGNCAESGAPVWFSETRTPSARGETMTRSTTLAAETYAYDSVGRLTETRETPAGEGCTVRLYGYDEESNRTSQTARAPGAEGKCATEGGTVVNHTYDEGNRLTDAGISYDAFGNVTKLPAADAEGHELASTFYVDNAVATQSQNGVSTNYYLDPEGRVRETVSGVNAIVAHYDSSGETIAWTSESGGKSTRNIPGIDGTLSATQTNGATAVLQLHDLQGDVVATAALSSSETKLLSTYNSTEFGVPNKEKTPPKFAWLGAGDVASALASGVITYGSTSYVPQTGMALQSEGVEPPGAPNGSGGGAAYVSQEEPWVFQGAAAAGAEAPGREAAREQAAAEAALAAATDPLQVHYMNKTKARDLAKKLWALGKAAEVADALDIPLDWVEAAVGSVGKIAVSTAVDWLVRTSEMMWKCGNNKWSVVGQKANICKLEYSVLDVAGTDLVNFTKRANVFVCLDNSGDTCFHQVFPDPPPEEVKCAFGLFCIAVIF
jgi:YD repeat-containing protein